MGYKTLLVHLDPGPLCAKRVEIAARLATRYEAHLAGLYVVRSEPLPGYARAELGPQYMERLLALEAQRAEEASRLFRVHADRAGLPGAELRCEAGEPAERVALHARYADLVVLGQASPDDERDWLPAGFPESAVLESARPVLLIPYAGSFATLGERVLVAWNGSREATRAIAGALPLLQGAKQVTVLAANPQKTGAHGDVPGADMAAYLARHGVKAEAASTVMRDIDVGSALLSRASDLGADLIVSGCYGHSRLRELVLGGVSRTLFEQMTVPVLMAH